MEALTRRCISVAKDCFNNMEFNSMMNNAVESSSGTTSTETIEITLPRSELVADLYHAVDHGEERFKVLLVAVMILRTVLHKLHKRKIGGYSSTFTMTNVIGFVPAVISCKIPNNELLIFVLIICVICMTTIHMCLNYVAYRMGLNYLLHQEDHIRERDHWFKRSADIKSELLKDDNNITDDFLQTHMIYYYVELEKDVAKIISENRWLFLTTRWLTCFEKVLQWIIAIVSAPIVVMLLYPVSKFKQMEYMDIGQVFFTVWLYFINIAILAFRQVNDVNETDNGHSDSDSDDDSDNDSNSNINSSSSNQQRHSFPADGSLQTIIQMASLGKRPNSWPS